MLRRRNFAVSSDAAEIVHTLEDNGPSHGGWGEDVTIETGQCVRSEAVGQQVIAANTLIGDSDAARVGRDLQTFRQDIGPAVVSVCCGAMAVGDGVSERHNGTGSRWCLHIDL